MLQTNAGDSFQPSNDCKGSANNIFCRTYQYSTYRDLIIKITDSFYRIYNTGDPLHEGFDKKGITERRMSFELSKN
ncbi:hypothetical protein D3C74_466130 [compost metagenome]